MARNKIQICRSYHIQPSEIDRMTYYEYEWLLIEIKALEEDEERRQQEYQENAKLPDYSKSMPKMPDYSSAASSFKMPDIKMPKI